MQILPKTFKSKSETDEHIKVKHVQQKKFKCDACSNMYSVESDLLQHIQIAHNTLFERPKNTN